MVVNFSKQAGHIRTTANSFTQSLDVRRFEEKFTARMGSGFCLVEGGASFSSCCSPLASFACSVGNSAGLGLATSRWSDSAQLGRSAADW